MTDFFEICGTMIPFAEIKSFRLVQREYIYRPVYAEYIEQEKTLFSCKNVKKISFCSMQPYAAILDEKEWHSALKNYRAKNFAGSLGKDIFEGVFSAIGEKAKVKAFKSKKYLCMNQTGRVFSTYLEDIPALYKSCDGQIFDLYKDNDTFILPAEKIASAVNIVPALEILAKEPYLFFGNEIHVSNIEAEYTRLKAELEIYKNSKTLHLPGNFPKIPGISAKKAQPSLPQSDTVMLELADIKQKYQNGSISEEEYQTAIQKIMLKL